MTEELKVHVVWLRHAAARKAAQLGVYDSALAAYEQVGAVHRMSDGTFRVYDTKHEAFVLVEA